MRWLGRRWSTLHRLVYWVAPLSILHYLWHKSGKNDYAEVGLYALVVAGLLGHRLWVRLRRVALPN
jgi:sulfoxide reductase heme-binding subunit YedZ